MAVVSAIVVADFDPLTHVTAAVVDAVVTLARRLVVVYGSKGRPVGVRVLVYQRCRGVGCDPVVTPVIEGLHRYGGYLGGVVEILLGRGLCSLAHHVGDVRTEGLHCENRFRIRNIHIEVIDFFKRIHIQNSLFDTVCEIT